VFGAEVVVGYVFAWLVRKGQRAAKRADGQVDEAIDAGVDRLGGKLHELVAGKLGEESSLVRLQEEADSGAAEPSSRTQQWMTFALEDAIEHDASFGSALEELVRQLQETQHEAASSADAATTAGRDVNVKSDRGSFAAGSVTVQGGLHFGNPTVPGSDQA
jgi:flagellar hook-basal body complex protein FliE